jgi:hypothetical protein
MATDWLRQGEGSTTRVRGAHSITPETIRRETLIGGPPGLPITLGPGWSRMLDGVRWRQRCGPLGSDGHADGERGDPHQGAEEDEAADGEESLAWSGAAQLGAHPGEEQCDGEEHHGEDVVG